MFTEYLNQPLFLPIAIKILFAFIIGGLIGIERVVHVRAAGLRTHILVAIGAALTSVISLCIDGGDIFRISAQVVSGIGFLGVGTIIMRRDTITGLTTAAGLWTTAILGIAVGYGLIEAALLCTFICLLTITLLSRVEKKQKSKKKIYVELDNPTGLNRFIGEIKTQFPEAERFSVLPCHSGISGNVGLVLTVSLSERGIDEIISYILKLESAVFAIEDSNV